MKRGEIIPKILEIVQNQAEATADILDIFTSGYGASYRKMKRTIKYGAPRFKSDWAFEYRERQKFYSLLNQLKNQGLVKKYQDKTKQGSFWKITKKGLEKLSLIKSKNLFGKNSVDYKRKPENTIKIIIFDIPEKERHKRAWLRAVLTSLDFSLLQRSVWMGKNKLPEKFIYDLDKRGILSYVQIFEISQKGTIDQVH